MSRLRVTLRWFAGAASAAWLLAPGPAGAADEQYSFDVSQFEKQPFEIGGYSELRIEHFRLDPGAALYQLNRYGQPRRTALSRASAAVELGALYRRGIATVQGTAHSEVQYDAISDSRTLRLYEGYLTLQPSAASRLEAGKRTLRWGKGYAWSPVGFIERPKDPNDPEQAREGFVMVSGSLVRSFSGPLQTVSLAAALVPTDEHLNEDFGSGSHANPAIRLSLLYRDTDIDFVALGQGARSSRYGFALSRNLGTNLEIHGEWSRVTDVVRPVFNPAGPPERRAADATSYLFGVRYLTRRDTTWIVEYYRDGAGYSVQEYGDYAASVHAANAHYSATGNARMLEAVRAVQDSYARPNSMRRYLYVRASQREPFDILYFTPSFTAIVNLDDRSHSLGPEITYTGFTGIELRARFFLLRGDRLSEFGEKQNSRRLELRARMFF